MVTGKEQRLRNLRIYLFKFAVFLKRQPTLEPFKKYIHFHSTVAVKVYLFFFEILYIVWL